MGLSILLSPARGCRRDLGLNHRHTLTDSRAGQETKRRAWAAPDITSQASRTGRRLHAQPKPSEKENGCFYGYLRVRHVPRVGARPYRLRAQERGAREHHVLAQVRESHRWVSLLFPPWFFFPGSSSRVFFFKKQTKRDAMSARAVPNNATYRVVLNVARTFARGAFGRAREFLCFAWGKQILFQYRFL